MANPMMTIGMPKIHFSGEKGTTPISEFLDTLEMHFLMIETSITNTTKLARLKLLLFQSQLKGRAKQWWQHHATTDQKSSYKTASTALRTRFPEANREQAKELGRAMAAFNVLK